jgi:hypothetical protein
MHMNFSNKQINPQRSAIFNWLSHRWRAQGEPACRLTIPSQEVQEGAFVVIRSAGWQFYGLVTDMQLGATDPRFADEQSETRLPAGLSNLLHGQTLFPTWRCCQPCSVGPTPGISSLAGRNLDNLITLVKTAAHATSSG